MHSFLKLAAVLGLALVVVDSEAEKPKGKDAKKDKNATPFPENKSANPAEADAKPKRLEVPVEKGHDAKGLKIPYFDGEGKLEMTFAIEVASRLDDDHLQMTNLLVETYGEGGEPEMSIDLPSSVFNLVTSVISTKKHVTIRRSDFEITGETMDYNTKTKQGTLRNGVRMTIYNLDDEVSETPEPTAP